MSGTGSGGHLFERASFGKFTYCRVCHELIWGLVKQGYRCHRCKFTAHKRCLAAASSTVCPAFVEPTAEPHVPAPPPPPPLPAPSAASSSRQTRASTFVPRPPPLVPPSNEPIPGIIAADAARRRRRLSNPETVEEPSFFGSTPAPPPPPPPSTVWAPDGRAIRATPAPRPTAAAGGRGALFADIHRGSRLRHITPPADRRLTLAFPLPSERDHFPDPAPRPPPAEPYHHVPPPSALGLSDRGAMLRDLTDPSRGISRLRHVDGSTELYAPEGVDASHRPRPAWRQRSTSTSSLVAPPAVAAAAAAAASATGPPKVRMLYAYTAATDVELTVSAGDVYIVTSTQDAWIHVRSEASARSGWIPRSYVEVVSGDLDHIAVQAPRPQATAAAATAQPKMGRATMNWTAQARDELTVTEGANLEILSADENGWTRCRCHGTVGVLPTIGVTVIASAISTTASESHFAQVSSSPLLVGSPVAVPERASSSSSATTTTTTTTADATVPNPKVDDEDLCKICMDRQMDTVLLWCGHVCVCQSCGRFIKNCPICRGQIFKVQRIFKV